MAITARATHIWVLISMFRGALVLGAEQAEHSTVLFLQKLLRQLPPRLSMRQ